MTVSDKEKQNWTVNESIVCECVGVKTGVSRIGKRQRPVFILELTTLATGAMLIKYYGVDKTVKGNYTVMHNSSFAKDFRLTIGVNPKADYSRAHRLLRKLIGYRFIADYVPAISNNGDHYLKATKLKPVEPIVTDEWTVTGHLRPKKKLENKSCQ